MRTKCSRLEQPVGNHADDGDEERAPQCSPPVPHGEAFDDCAGCAQEQGVDHHEEQAQGEEGDRERKEHEHRFGCDVEQAEDESGAERVDPAADADAAHDQWADEDREERDEERPHDTPPNVGLTT